MSIASASALVPTRVDAPSRARVHRRARANVVVVARASSTQDDDGADLSRRGLLSSGEWARMSQAPISTRHVYPTLVADLPRRSLSLFVRSRDGRRDGRRDTPRSHRRALRRPKRVRRERHGPPTRPARLNPAQVFQRGAVTDHQRDAGNSPAGTAGTRPRTGHPGPRRWTTSHPS